MPAETELLDLSRTQRQGGLSGMLPRADHKLALESEEESCAAFGYLRGLHDRALMVEFRFHNGNSVAMPYSWLGPVQFNPSVGLLLKFTGDVVTHVLIRGSNLNAGNSDHAVNLTDRGLLRHRVTWVREMHGDELRTVANGEAVIDRIEIAEFESPEERKQWLKTTAPAFA